MNCLHLKQSKFKIALSKERTILTVKSIKILLYVCTLRLYLTLPIESKMKILRKPVISNQI